MSRKIISTIFIVVVLLTVFQLSSATRIASASAPGSSPEDAWLLTFSTRYPNLVPNREEWYNFSFEDYFKDWQRGPNYERALIKLNFDGLVYYEPDQNLINQLGRNSWLIAEIYSPNQIHELLQARRNQTSLPKPVGRLTPQQDTSGNIRYWSWNGGNRNTVDMKTELGKGVWLIRLLNTSTKEIEARLILCPYNNGSKHPDPSSPNMEDINCW